MKRFKNVAYITTSCFLASVIGFFVYSFTQFNNGSTLTQETFINGFYRTKNTKDFLSFGSFKNSVICVNNVYYFVDVVKYEKGIFTLVDKEETEKVYLFSVVDENIIYSSSFNTYFYNIILWQE